MNKHERINELLVDFALGDLSQQQEAEVKTHLAECHQCSTEMKRLEELLECTERIRELSADKRMCESAKQAILETVEAEEMEPVRRTHINVKHLWSAVVNSKMAKLAAAAVIIIAILIGINHLGGSIDGATVAFAQIKENMEKMAWMHVTVEGAGEKLEAWFSFERRVMVSKRVPGEIRYHDGLKQTVQIYDPVANTITVSYTTADALAGMGRSALDFPKSILKLFDEAGQKIIQETGKYEGKDSKIYKMSGFFGGMDMRVEMIVDIDKNVLLFINQKAFDETGTLKIEANGYFDYPENGPNDIYQAGAPPDAQVKIIDDRDPEFLEAIKPYRAARENLPQCVVVETEADERGAIRTICVVYNDSINERFERIETNVTSDSIPSDESFQSLLTWASDIGANSIWAQLYDGEYIYRARRDYEDFWSIKEKEYSPKRNHRSYNGGLADRGWPEHVMYKGKVIENNYSTENGLICIEKQNEPLYEGKKLRYPAEKTLYYIDPQRGYMCVRKEQFQHHLPPYEDPVDVEDLDFAPDDIPAEPYSITEVVEFGQTDAGQWYPKRLQQWSRKCFDQGYGWETSEETKTITLYLETNLDFPDGIFDPNGLVPTGAKIRKEGEKTSFEKHFEQAIAIVDSREHWPEPRELVSRYWQARSAKDYDEMAILWPGSASWSHRHVENEKPVEYVFGETRKAGDNRVIVPYAARSYYEEHGTYNLKMWLHNNRSTKGRYYIFSGN